jgi:hypothetical protein
MLRGALGRGLVVARRGRRRPAPAAGRPRPRVTRSRRAPCEQLEARPYRCSGDADQPRLVRGASSRGLQLMPSPRRRLPAGESRRGPERRWTSAYGTVAPCGSPCSGRRECLRGQGDGERAWAMSPSFWMVLLHWDLEPDRPSSSPAVDAPSRRGHQTGALGEHVLEPCVLERVAVGLVDERLGVAVHQVGHVLPDPVKVRAPQRLSCRSRTRR